jgi:hypothetical protein
MSNRHWSFEENLQSVQGFEDFWSIFLKGVVG